MSWKWLELVDASCWRSGGAYVNQAGLGRDVLATGTKGVRMPWPKVKMNSERSRNSTNWTKLRLVSEFHDGKQHGASSQRSGHSCANEPRREELWSDPSSHECPRAGEAVLAQFRVPFCRLGRSIFRRAAMKTLEVERPQKRPGPVLLMSADSPPC